MIISGRSLLPPKEQLASVLDKFYNVHAVYPSATMTPCGLVAEDLPSSVERHGPEPTCPECVAWAEVCERVDGSTPEHWGWKEEAA